MRPFSVSVFRRRFVLRRTIPRLAVALCLFASSQIGFAQESPAETTNVSGALPDGRATAPGPRATAGGSDKESLPDLVRRVKPSVVSVLTYDSKGEPLISGTGFFVRTGEVITNMHVLRGAQRVEIHTLDGKDELSGYGSAGDRRRS